MAGIKDYSPTPASNTALFPEGMAPSAVNDGMRQVQADLREWYNDAQWAIFGDGDGASTISYASATSFIAAGADVTAQYHAGRRVKATGALTGRIYGTITASAFSTNTTVTVAWDSGALQNEAITVYLAALSATDQSLPVIYFGGMAGEIRLWAGASAPSGWLLCDGAAVSRTAYAALFAVIGTTFGPGDGSTTFNLPDSRGRTFIGAGAGAGLTNRVLGQVGGEEVHVLSQAEMPRHQHFVSGATDTQGNHIHRVFHTGQTNLNGGAQLGGQNGANDAANTDGVEAAGAHAHNWSGNTDFRGSGAAHNNMQPFVVGNWIIKM